MLWVAAGEPLPARLIQKQSDGVRGGSGVVPYSGWAIESRVYAEDALRGFLPSTGPLITYREPRTVVAGPETGSQTVRVDSGVYEGRTISMYYDPMIAKLCTHAPTR
jgi:propionyl-CoA carboxylase alpha chain